MKFLARLSRTRRELDASDGGVADDVDDDGEGTVWTVPCEGATFDELYEYVSRHFDRERFRSDIEADGTTALKELVGVAERLEIKVGYDAVTADWTRLKALDVAKRSGMMRLATSTWRAGSDELIIVQRPMHRSVDGQLVTEELTDTVIHELIHVIGGRLAKKAEPERVEGSIEYDIEEFVASIGTHLIWRAIQNVDDNTGQPDSQELAQANEQNAMQKMKELRGRGLSNTKIEGAVRRAERSVRIVYSTMGAMRAERMGNRFAYAMTLQRFAPMAASERLRRGRGRTRA